MKKIITVLATLILGIVLVACKVEKSFSVSFVTNIENYSIEDQRITNNQLIIEPKVNNIDGKEFKGWFFTSEFKEKITFETYTVTKDVVLYAKWEDVNNKYEVTLVLNNGADDIVTSVNENDLLEIPNNITNENLTLIGWYLTSDFKGEPINTTNYKVTSSITLYAKWEDQSVQYTVTFVLNNELEDIIETFNFNNLIRIPDNIKNGSLVLTGWYLDSEFIEDAVDISNYKITSNITLYARWDEAITVKAKQNMTNGNLDDNASVNNAKSINLEPNHFNVGAKKGKSNLPGLFNDEFRLYVGSGITFKLNDNYIINKITIKFSKFNDTIGQTEVKIGTSSELLSNHNNKLVTYSNLNINDFSMTNISDVTVERVYISYIEITYILIGEKVESEDDTNRPVIDIEENKLIELSIGDTFERPILNAYDVEDGEITVEYLNDTIDIHRIGIYYVFYSATDNDGNVSNAFITIIVREENQIESYYSSIAENATGEQLKESLHEILKNTVNLKNYGTGNVALEISDRDPYNFNNVYLIYNGESTRGKWNATNWNKEHVWAKSAFGKDDTGKVHSSGAEASDIGTMSDLHNLRAINRSVNSTHSNHEFTNVETNNGMPFGLATVSQRLLNPYTPGKDLETTSLAYNPGDEHKGDVARILLYMQLLYNLFLREDIEMLVNWHLEDPVDSFEIIRNEVIFSYQDNRNPFIDYPEFVTQIYS